MNDILRAEEEFILFKLNSGAYGSLDAPTEVNAIPVYDLGYSQNFNREQLQEALGFPGSPFEKVTGGYQELSFKAYVRGSGEADKPSVLGPLLRAAGNSETITVDSDVTYAPVSEAFEHGTLYYYVGGSNGVLHKLVGVRLTAKLVSKVGALDYIEFTAMGLDVDPEPAGALPAVDWTGLSVPLHTAANTVQTMNLMGQNVGMSSLTVTLGNTFSHLHVTNQEAIAFESRQGSVEITIVEPSPNEKNYWLAAKQGEQGAMTFQRGLDATHLGNILKLVVPNVQLSTVTRSKDAGRLYLDLKLNIKPLTKNSDYQLLTK